MLKKSMVCSVFFGIVFCDGAVSQDNIPDFRRNQYKNNLSDEAIWNEESSGIENPLFRSLEVSSDLFRSKGRENSAVRAVVPLVYDELKNNIFFAAPGVTYYQKRMTYNFGLGFRHFNDNKDFFWGVNSFFDYDSKGGNRRLSEGLEIGVPYVSLLGNVYQGLSNARTSKSDNTKNEKTANGYDVKLHVLLPVYPQIALSARYFSWQGKGIDLYGDKKYSDSPYGFVYGVEYKPVNLVGISIQRTFEQHHHRSNTALFLNISYDFSRSFSDQIAFSSMPEAYALSSQAFRQIDREYGVVLKTKTKEVPMQLLTPASSHVPIYCEDSDSENYSEEEFVVFNASSSRDSSPVFVYESEESYSESGRKLPEFGSESGLSSTSSLASSSETEAYSRENSVTTPRLSDEMNAERTKITLWNVPRHPCQPESSCHVEKYMGIPKEIFPDNLQKLQKFRYECAGHIGSGKGKCSHAVAAAEMALMTVSYNQANVPEAFDSSGRLVKAKKLKNPMSVKNGSGIKQNRATVKQGKLAIKHVLKTPQMLSDAQQRLLELQNQRR